MTALANQYVELKRVSSYVVGRILSWLSKFPTPEAYGFSQLFKHESTVLVCRDLADLIKALNQSA